MTQYMRCGECSQPLVHLLKDGINRYLHPPLAGQGTQRDHPPKPVPTTEEEIAITLCDFCYSPGPAWIYSTREDIVNNDVRLENSGATYDDNFARAWKAIRPEVDQVGSLVTSNSANWTACEECAVLVEKEDINRLVTRIKRVSPYGGKSPREALFWKLKPFFDTRNPGREAVSKKEEA